MFGITEPTVTSGASGELDTRTSVLIFSVWYLQLSAKCKDDSLAVRKPIGSVPAHQAQ